MKLCEGRGFAVPTNLEHLEPRLRFLDLLAGVMARARRPRIEQPFRMRWVTRRGFLTA